MSDIPAAAPSFRVQIGRYRFGAYSAFNWEVDDGCTGTSGYKTPIGAMFGLIRARRRLEHHQPKSTEWMINLVVSLLIFSALTWILLILMTAGVIPWIY
jgi:hypothetical protein